MLTGTAHGPLFCFDTKSCSGKMENRNSWTLSLAIFYLNVALAIYAYLPANLRINKLFHLYFPPGPPELTSSCSTN